MGLGAWAFDFCAVPGKPMAALATPMARIKLLTTRASLANCVAGH
jgi:hypothetical protein